jgi:hypothetical protein
LQGLHALEKKTVRGSEPARRKPCIWAIFRTCSGGGVLIYPDFVKNLFSNRKKRKYFFPPQSSFIIFERIINDMCFIREISHLRKGQELTTANTEPLTSGLHYHDVLKLAKIDFKKEGKKTKLLIYFK